MTDRMVDRSDWMIPEGVAFLNHGSFGPTPRVVHEVREEWSRRLASQPMRVYLREIEPALQSALERLARFVGTSASNLAFVDNATFAMNAVAATLRLQPGDEVLLNDHEYGAVFRIWRAAAEAAGANVVTAVLPRPLTNPTEVVAALEERITPRTRLLVVSHVTSPTAIVLPVDEICRMAKRQDVPVCIDGPHAIGMRPLELDALGCDFYCASLHKWLSAPLGSGFLYVNRNWQNTVACPIVSWGRSLAGRPPVWQDVFRWIGTRDPATFLAVPAAIEFLESFGLDRFRDQTHQLLRDGLARLESEFGAKPLAPVSRDWLGSMAAVTLPSSNRSAKPYLTDPLQTALADDYSIEIPVVWWHEDRHIRLSCHLHTTVDDLERLVAALRELLPRFP